MKNLSIFGNFLKSFVFIFLALGVLSSEVFGADINVATSGTATQSSVNYSGVASRAIDGNTNGDYTQASVTYADATDYEWWQVDLGSKQTISQIKIYNRTDANPERLANVWVMVSDTPFYSKATNSLGLNFSKNHADWKDQVSSTRAQEDFTLSTPTNGRYVLIQKDNTSGHKALSLAEVKVFASPVTPCPSCDCSLDTDSSTWDNPITIPELNNVSQDKETCLSGVKNNTDHYIFTAGTDGKVEFEAKTLNNKNLILESTDETSNGYYNSDLKGSFYVVSGDKILLNFSGAAGVEYEYKVKFIKTLPDGIYLDNDSIDANQPAGTLVGNLTTHPTGNTYTYNIQEVKDSNGTAITTNFQITGDKLESAEIFTTDATYDVKVQSCKSTGNLPFMGGTACTDKVFTITVSELTAEGTQDFAPIYTGNAFSKMLFIGNTSLCKRGNSGNNNSGNGTNICDPAGAGTDPLNPDDNNNRIHMINNDYDNSRTTGSDETTRNSSAALLDVPAGKEVVFAGLFWSGVIGPLDTDLKAHVSKVKLKHADESSYTTITASKLNTILDGKYYQSYAEVTTQVNSKKGGYWWVGDIMASEGNVADTQIIGGSFGAWSLIVVYVDEDEEMRNTTIYHGYQVIISTDKPGKSPIESTLSGFLTPNDGNVSSTLSIFATEGDIFSDGQKEYAYIRDQDGNEKPIADALNPHGTIMNNTITKDGQHVTTGLPHYSNNALGVDIDTYNIGNTGTNPLNIIGNGQSSIDLKFTAQDYGYFLGMFALETQLYVPNLCYDYAYSQNNIYLTELNYDKHDPRLISRNGSFNPNYPIDVKFYIRNTEASDTISSDTKFYLLDINTSAAPYVANSTYVTPPNSNQEQAFRYDGSAGTQPLDFVHDTNNSLSTHDYQIMNIYNGAVKAHEFFYVYFELDPQVSDINMSLNARLDYTVQMFDENNDPLLVNPMKYEIMLNEEIALCAENPFVYTPEKGIFNIVHDAFWSGTTEGDKANGTTRAYNLPTQVVKRNGNFSLLAFEEDSATETEAEKYNTLKSVETIVGIEVIDASGWADATTTCTDSQVSVTPILWIPFQGATNTPVTHTQIKNAFNALRENRLNPLTDTNATIFNRALESAAFRITYQLTGDGNNTILQIDGNNGDGTKDSGAWNVENFSDAAKGACTGDPDNDGNFNDQVSTWCDNAGDASSMTNAELADCMVCINGKFTKQVCSRDDFAIRPEAFLLEVTDMNQSTGVTASNEIIGGDDGLATTQLAAGYNYSLRATATTHVDNSGSLGYYKNFNEQDYISDASNTDELSYNWIEPPAVNCNDENSTHGANGNFRINEQVALATEIIGGIGEGNTSMAQVGIYSLSMHDSTWTKSDYDFTTPNHPHGINTNYFKNTGDCSAGSNVSVQTSSALNGCNISSSHTNLDNSLEFVTQTYQFNPYKFGVRNTVTLGLNDRGYDASTPPSSSNFVYMNNIATPADENMSVHFNTNIIAQGFNNTNLTNFVAGCYAKSVDINLSKSDTNNTELVQRYIVHDLNSTATVTGVIAAGLNADANITTPNTYFIKAMNGVVNTRMNINYDRNGTAQNPEDINFTTVTVSDPRTSLNADLSTMNAKGENNATTGQISTVINHFYGRTAAKKTRIVCNTDNEYNPLPNNICSSGVVNHTGEKAEPNVFIYYELYCMGTTNGKVCDKNLIPKLVASARVVQKVDSRWFTNIAHVEANDGNLTFTQGNTPATATSPVTVPTIRSDNNFTKNSTHTYDMSKGLPYTAEMNSTVSPWFIYEDGKTTAQARNKHIVIFTPEAEWSGENESNSTTKTDRVRRINRRTMW